MSVENEEQDPSSLAGFDLSASRQAAASAEASDQLWKLSVANRWRLHKNATPENVLEIVCEYFQWCVDNPLLEAKLVTYEGVSTLEHIPRMRAMTLKGLCSFLCIHIDTWASWRRGDDRRYLQPVVKWAEQVIYDQKFSGAAAGFLNPNIIARDLGLAEKSELTGGGGAPLQIIVQPMQEGVFFAPDEEPESSDN